VKQNLNRTKPEIEGKPIKFKRAAEPTDYIWENLHYSKKHQKYYFWVVILALAVTLGFGYFV
jgi:hypothetical protein